MYWARVRHVQSSGVSQVVARSAGWSAYFLEPCGGGCAFGFSDEGQGQMFLLLLLGRDNFSRLKKSEKKALIMARLLEMVSYMDVAACILIQYAIATPFTSIPTSIESWWHLRLKEMSEQHQVTSQE